MDARISLIEVVHNEISALRQSLEFSQQQIDTLSSENKTLKDSVSTLSSQLTVVTSECKTMKETILDLQTRSMRDNLVFSGIPETPTENSETVIKDFITTQLKLSPDIVKNITFHRVHRIGPPRKDSKYPRPIVAKFEHFKQKVQIQGRCRELKGTHFGVNDQFPKEILQRRQKLHPIRKEMLKKGHKSILIVDKLYIDGQLYRNKDTPWLL